MLNEQRYLVNSSQATNSKLVALIPVVVASLHSFCDLSHATAIFLIFLFPNVNHFTNSVFYSQPECAQRYRSLYFCLLLTKDSQAQKSEEESNDLGWH